MMYKLPIQKIIFITTILYITIKTKLNNWNRCHINLNKLILIRSNIYLTNKIYIIFFFFNVINQNENKYQHSKTALDSCESTFKLE